jgi:hypothetical protein
VKGSERFCSSKVASRGVVMNAAVGRGVQVGGRRWEVVCNIGCDANSIVTMLLAVAAVAILMQLQVRLVK